MIEIGAQGLEMADTLWFKVTIRDRMEATRH